ncbi:acyl-CoA thioester hydrolase [Prosthecobacter fusiformis]|uniref:Acyl-CoA thioester hydrolase n=1 Tax=Prosthecobacter fusiformis TaxID=48464 RepID=A0A4R7RND7_9BACT|nr:thioesterase family protein [Prosthecobacter fusiformis]TDU66529.1 acyl-CoA thioester hydrolase [Prosthecobacter fusiformis]
MHRHTLTDRVQFADTDMAGIVHFSNFFRYIERVEHDFFRALGMSIWDKSAEIPVDERVGWPRVHVSCDFRAPLVFEEEFTMELLVEEVRPKTLRYLVRFWKQDGALSAEGKLVAACVRRDPATGKMKAVTIPDRIRSRITAAPPELLAPV